MSFNDFWNTSNRANDFLRTGKLNDTVRDSNTTFSVKTKDWDGNITEPPPAVTAPQGGSCHSTSQCPAGWACIGYVCTQMTPGSGDQQWQSAGSGGDCDPNDPVSPCNAGGEGACQQAPTCEGGLAEEARDCCGTRCCSFGSASSPRPGVHCFCGKCPPYPGCTQFCDNYLKANGDPGPGCKEGFKGNSCDNCTYCEGNVGGECKPIEVNAPCWCEQSTDCSQASPGFNYSHKGCLECQTDETKPGFGDCTYVGDEKCQDCSTIRNYMCPCNKVIDPVTACAVRSEGVTAISKAQKKARDICDELCEADPNECVPRNRTEKRCCFEDYGDCTNPSCDPGTIQIGSIFDDNGYGCVICQYPEEFVDSCCVPECNCHDDCGECEQCNNEGKCEESKVGECADYKFCNCYPEEDTYYEPEAKIYVQTLTNSETSEITRSQVTSLTLPTTSIYVDTTKIPNQYYFRITYIGCDGSPSNSLYNCGLDSNCSMWSVELSQTNQGGCCTPFVNSPEVPCDHTDECNDNPGSCFE